ncbi:hypothetical protein FXO37_33561 [Capsicum annuum]|nr:hypothetical protein FXO37_33561 [Capsicum annuum]
MSQQLCCADSLVSTLNSFRRDAGAGANAGASPIRSNESRDVDPTSRTKLVVSLEVRKIGDGIRDISVGREKTDDCNCYCRRKALKKQLRGGVPGELARTNRGKLFEAMAIFFESSNRSSGGELQAVGGVVRRCGLCLESDMVLRQKSDGSFMVGCLGYPQVGAFPIIQFNSYCRNLAIVSREPVIPE